MAEVPVHGGVARARSRRTRVRYLVGGLLFGCCFPLVAWILDILIRSAAWSPAGIWYVHLVNPLHWIVDLAPPVLGMVGWLIGRQQELVVVSEGRFRALVQNASDLIVVLDPDTTIRYATPSLAVAFETGLCLGEKMVHAVHPDDRAAFVRTCADVGRWPRRPLSLEYRLARADGCWRQIEASMVGLLDTPEVAGLLLTGRDVTERKELEAQFADLAFRDLVTGMPNRALFLNRLEHALAAAPTGRGQTGLLYVDLDNFKIVNDSLGHAAGDELLCAVGTRLQASIRTQDTAARLGGDEFTVLLDGLQDVADALSVVETIERALGAPLLVTGREVAIRASIGVALADEADSPSHLLRKADLAMYEAKAHGGGRSHLFDPALAAIAQDRLELAADLPRALDQNEFRIFYQPIIELASGLVEEVEALVRWQHPQRGLVQPLLFIPIAEQTGLIVPLGRWVLEQACRQACDWQRQWPDRPPVVISVNLSARQFADPRLVEDVSRVLRETGLDPKTLKLEITESVAMQDAAGAETAMRALKSLGVGLAIDDFGTGYSSMQYLKRFAVDTLKIDRSFVDGLGTDAQDTAIVQCVVALARTLQLDITAEGVETGVQAAQLRLLGVERAQGYLYARPLPALEVGPLLGCPSAACSAA